MGGYQVRDKWLKDRKERQLSYEDVIHYCKIATALQHTIKIQSVLDALYPEAEKNIVNVNKAM